MATATREITMTLSMTAEDPATMAAQNPAILV
jgi:hypothetical protein